MSAIDDLRWANARVAALLAEHEALRDVERCAVDCLEQWEGAACIVTPPCGDCAGCRLVKAVARLDIARLEARR